MQDPLKKPEFRVVLDGADDALRASLEAALVDVTLELASDLARFHVVQAEGDADDANAMVFVTKDGPSAEACARYEALSKAKSLAVVAVHDADREVADAICEAWRAHAVVVVRTTSADAAELRAVLANAAIAGADAAVEDVRRAKRPYAAAIVGGAALVAAAEAFLPGAAGFVVLTQASAISSLSYLYTGKWMGRGQALALLPTFATEAVGGSVFLIAKSFFPPTGVADVAAGAVAASLTLTTLGAITVALDMGYSFEQKDQMKLAFRRLKARTAKERADLLRNRGRWSEKGFWKELAMRLLFEN